MSISIITPTYNAASTIADCLTSVRSQTCPVEHLVIDGRSSDGTLDVVKQISPDARIVSEPDRGIYDAMNKGIRYAGGEVIGILNADDFFADDRVLERVGKIFADPAVDACYGDLEYLSAVNSPRYYVRCSTLERSLEDICYSLFKVVRCWKSGDFHPHKFYRGWMPPHPTFFVRKRVYEKYGLFNLNLGSAADYELMLRFLLKHRIKCRYIPRVLVKMRTGGVSNGSLKNRIRANLMDRRAWEVNGLKPYPWTLLMKPLSKIPQYFAV